MMNSNREDEELELPAFDYYEELRHNTSIPFRVQDGSSIVSIPAEFTQLANHNLTSIRLAHIASMLAVTNPLYWRIDPIWHNVQAAGVLALKHLNERSGRVIPELPQRMESCPDLFFTMDPYDSIFSPIHAAGQFALSIVNRKHSLQTPLPIALSGATRSEVSETLATLSGVLGIPQVSPISTSESLDHKEMFPFFCRTTSTNDAIARGLAALIHSWGTEHPHVAVLYARNTVGISHHKYFSNAGRNMGIHILGAPYEVGNQKSLDDAIQRVIDSGYRYISLAPELGGFAATAQRAYELGLGRANDYVFVLSETNVEVITAGYALPNASHYGAASILNGSVIILPSPPPTLAYQEAMQEEFLDSTHVMEYYTQKHPAKQLFLKEAFVFDPILDAKRSNFAGGMQSSQYDVIMTLGMAACQMEDPFFTGPQLFEAIRNTSFHGLTGTIRFQEDTCSRDPTTVHYLAYNFVAKPLDENGLYWFDTNTHANVLLESNVSSFGEVQERIEVLQNYTYRDGTSMPPPSIPPVELDMNHISLGAQILGLVLAFLVMILAVALATWSLVHRKTRVVRQKQPLFLVMCCVGAIHMAGSIIPLSLQEPTEHLDAACMSTLWLASMGFSTAFAALSSKTWRVNTIFQHAQRFRRIQVTHRDVSLPVVVILMINLSLLCAMQAVAPLVWKRVLVDNNYDIYDRPKESYGTCAPSSSTTRWLLGAIFFLNFGAVLLSNIQVYLSRNLPHNLSESKEVAFSMLMLLEACLVGIPVLVLVHDIPNVRFIVTSCLLFVVCLGILVPQLPIQKAPGRSLRASSHVEPTTRKLSSLPPPPSGHGDGTTLDHTSMSFSGRVVRDEGLVAHVRYRQIEQEKVPEFHEDDDDGGGDDDDDGISV
ncbi:acid type B receptor subunit 2 [Seminavis robusta]|uniref:Acid type B receptor subunit 2 n=1 Tax=Seminavis robusta TaxID=568900 RepID=A0A9N8HIH6_9STRA|nr:acid type B receptor subunit 2 [Seminavis robusta]|eukprot:Sro501_g155460.1 acid type B receptor subunit 2 (884) ;mRNA; r:27308-29959